MNPSAPSRRLDITLLKERSGGTFAKVYLAEATGAGGISRLVAVKVLREKWAQADEFLARTKDEARLLAQLRHPSIVRVEDLVELNGQLAIVMEFVDGIDLQQLIETLKKRGQRLPPRVAYSVVQRAAAALDVAWRKAPYGRTEPIRVVHRDVKPSNIMLTPEGELKILDFGTARGSFENRAAHTTMFRFGSLKYMSPERRFGDRGDHPSDVYALGLMLIEFLHGGWLQLLPEPPDHESAITTAVNAIEDTGMPAADWDEAVRKVLLQMCADAPEHRPTAEQVVKLMRAFADQAAGPSLEAFCADVVGPVAAEVYPQEGGTLAGTQLVINQSGDRPKDGPPLGSPIQAAAPTMPPPEPEPPPPPPRRRAPTEPPIEALSPPQQVASGPIASGPIASGPVAGDRTMPPPEPAAAPPVKKRGPLIFVLVGALAFFFFGGIAVVGGVWFFLFRDGSDVPDVDPVVVDAPEDPPPPPEPTGVELAVTVSGELVQWARVLDATGGSVLKGDEAGVTGTIEPGEYQLAVKLVGRPTATAPLTVADSPISFDCTVQRGGKVKCVDPQDQARQLMLDHQ
ncbi:MAG: serine/threonine protein kinase [Alphaproteobacteria bacterium]|nr:serine/threonine protein kinase [Alphaproteobacteria bacterium]